MQDMKDNMNENLCSDVEDETGEDLKKEVVDSDVITSNTHEPIEHEKKSGKTIKIIIGICILVALVGILFTVNNNNRKRKELIAQQQAEKEDIQEYNSYIENLNLLYASTLSGASNAESVCVLVCNVWQDAIFGDYNDETKKYVTGASDFNEAVNRVYSDEDIKKKLNEITDRRDRANTYIQNLQFCPEELDKAYDIALEVNTDFNALADLALNPSGNYNSYSTSEKEKVDAFVKSYVTLKAVIPPKKTVPFYDAKGNKIDDPFAIDIYLNQLADKLPNTVDGTFASMLGIYKDSATICGYDGDISYFHSNEVIQAISWETDIMSDDEINNLVNKMKEKYGEVSFQDETSYSWSENLACHILMSITDEKVRINWMSAL